MTELSTLHQTLLAICGAGIGTLVAVRIGISHKKLCALISFAAGTLLGTAFLVIIPESRETLSALHVALSVSSGYLVFHLISRYLAHVCPACAASHVDVHLESQEKSLALLFCVALTIHSSLDGLALTLSHHLSHHAHNSVALSVLVHKIPEGLALGAILMRQGRSAGKSFLIAILLESTTLLGWVGGNLFDLLEGHHTTMWINILMAHTAGGFVFLAFHAIINESKKHNPNFTLTCYLIGVLLIFFTA